MKKSNATSTAASDPRLIPGIYNYCHGRCERCPFTDRCLTFRRMREDEARHPGEDVLEAVGRNFARTFDLLKDWCEKEGIDFEQMREEANSEKRPRRCAARRGDRAGPAA